MPDDPRDREDPASELPRAARAEATRELRKAGRRVRAWIEVERSAAESDARRLDAQRARRTADRLAVAVRDACELVEPASRTRPPRSGATRPVPDPATRLTGAIERLKTAESHLLMAPPHTDAPASSTALTAALADARIAQAELAAVIADLEAQTAS